MIRRYNRTQSLKAIFLCIGGLFCCWLAYLFFRYVPAFLASQLKYDAPGWVVPGIVVFGMVATWFSGYRTWKTRGGLFSYHESGLYHRLDYSTAGANVVSFYTHRITGPAYVVGQVFLAGPLLLLRAWTLLHSRIAPSETLESKLAETLAMLRTANKWQGLDEYPELRDEILYLAQMGYLDFSAYKGTPRFKARGQENS